MANRTVSVSLQADIGRYVSGMTRAAAATKAVGVEAQATQAKATRGFDLAGRGALLLGAGVVAGLGAAVSKSMDFERSMSAVQAATQATASTLGDLRQAAIKAGQDTQFSATEAADAITEMAKAGVSAADIMSGGLTGALALAAAGQMDVAEAAGIASTAMTQFGLSGAQLPHVADLLAAGAGKAMGSVDDLGMALNQAGLLASSTGISIEETTGALAAFASAGLLGSDAGTSFKTMLQQLQNPSKESAELMAQLGINAYNAQGNFVGLEGLAGQLQSRLGGLTQAQRDQAIAQIFGSDAARAANVLYREGATGIAEWTAKVNDAGYAQRQAAQLTDNLAGDLERLGGAFDTFLIDAGSGAQGPLRELVQELTSLVGVAGDVLHVVQAIPTPVLLAIGAFAAWSKWGSPISSMLETGAVKAMYFGEAVKTATTSTSGFKNSLSSLAGSINPVGIALAVATVYVTDFLSAQASVDAQMTAARDASESLSSALIQQSGAWDEVTRQAAATAVQTAGLKTALDDMGVSQSVVNQALMGGKQSYDEVIASLEEYDTRQLAASAGANTIAVGLSVMSGEATRSADAFRELSGTTGDIEALGRVVGPIPEALRLWGQGGTDAAVGTDAAAAAAAAAAPPVDALTQELQATADAADASKQATDRFKLSLAALTGAHVSMLEVQSAFYASLDAAKGALDNVSGSVLTTTGSLNLQSEAGRKTSDTLIGLADDASTWIATMIEQGATADEAKAKDAELRQSFWETALQMTGSRDAADKLTDSIYGIPEEHNTQIDADTHNASSNVANFQRQVDDLHGKTVTVTVVADRGASAIFTQIHNPNAAISIQGGHAAGGHIRGPGGPTDDTAGLFALSDGEYVVKASSVQKYGVSLLDALNQGRLQVPGYAAGGAIQVNMDSRPLINTALGVFELMKKAYEPGSAALAFARSQVGKPYVWGGVGPGGYDCSGFMSAITNVLRGQNPYSRVGSTATFPWAGFAPGYGSLFTIGSAASLRGGVGHMAGNLMGVNVESAGGVGVRMGAGARGPDWGYFNTRAHLAMAGGGVIGEPVFGIGARTGNSYSFAERGPEVVLPRGREVSGYGRGGGGGTPSLLGLTIEGRVTVDGDGIARIAGRVVREHEYRQGVKVRSS